MDKRLLKNLVTHTETHNRVIEEEQCWREILHRRKERDASKDRSHHHHHHRSPNTAKVQQALDAYERELRREAKRRLEEQASSDLPATGNNSNFWIGLVKRQKAGDRWGHDGWEELQRPGPPAPLHDSFRAASSIGSTAKVKGDLALSSTSAPAPKLPVHHSLAPDRHAQTNNSDTVDKPSVSHEKRKKDKKKKKTEHKSKPTDSRTKPADKSHQHRAKTKRRHSSRGSSISTVHSDEEVEWLERK